MAKALWTIPVLLMALAAQSAPPTSDEGKDAQPISVERIREMLASLDSPDAAERDAASERLVALRGVDFENFKTAVQQAVPLSPEQRTLLPATAVHLYLRASSYVPAPTDPRGGPACLGVTMSAFLMEEVYVAGVDRPVLGYQVMARVPGLPAYAVLHDGDYVVAAGAISGGDLAAQFSDYVKSQPVGSEIRLRVVRDGHLKDVKVRLAPRPADYDGTWGQRWEAIGEAWWETKFAPTLDVPPPASAPSVGPGPASSPVRQPPRAAGRDPVSKVSPRMPAVAPSTRP